MLEITSELRPENLCPKYPNYHTGDYFEEYFFKRFVKDFPDLCINGFHYIPIFWTNCYVNTTFRGSNYNIQSTIDSFDKSIKYFTISQHDDCIYEKFEFPLIIFSMGGNSTGEHIIPIPLICSPIEKSENLGKDIIVSFVGSETHPIRKEIIEKYGKNDSFFIKSKSWDFNTGEDNINLFKEITSRSRFTLCPRGYGKTSFRMYEAMQLDSVPIYIFDEEWLPWKDEVNWEELIIKVQSNEIDLILDKINSFDYDLALNYKKKIYQEYFTFDGVYKKILENLSKK